MLGYGVDACIAAPLHTDINSANVPNEEHRSNYARLTERPELTLNLVHSGLCSPRIITPQWQQADPTVTQGGCSLVLT